MIVAGLDETVSPVNTIGYLYWPAAVAIITTAVIFAPIGARLTHVLPTSLLQQNFCCDIGCCRDQNPGVGAGRVVIALAGDKTPNTTDPLVRIDSRI